MNANPWAFGAGHTSPTLGADSGDGQQMNDIIARLLGGLGSQPGGGFSGSYVDLLKQAGAGGMASGLLKGLF